VVAITLQEGLVQGRHAGKLHRSRGLSPGLGERAGELTRFHREAWSPSMKSAHLAMIAALLLAGCASAPTLYQPSAGPQSVGYSEYRIEPGRFRITFRGGPGASPEQVSNYALRRAADLTLGEGYDWFRVSERFLRQDGRDNSPRIGLGVGGGNGGYHSGVGVGLGASFSLGGGPAVAATLEVVMGRGEKPSTPDAYDARGIRRAMGEPI
jgi:opacity protein-like surface antigen